MEKKQLLIVDDDQDISQILAYNLEREGYSVITAASGEEALSMIDDACSLILLDVMMSGISGYEVAKTLRNDRNNNTPIIFLTAKTAEEDLLTGFNVGGDDYITKPFSIKEVVARVKSMLRRADTAVTPPKKPSMGYEIDYLRKRVQVAEESLSLTRKEFEILSLLSQHPNKLFSREDIIKAVWEADVFVVDRTVDVHIARLRKKMGVAGECIVNRWGYGYCIES